MGQIKGDHRFWSMLPLTRAPFWGYPIFDHHSQVLRYEAIEQEVVMNREALEQVAAEEEAAASVSNSPGIWTPGR